MRTSQKLFLLQVFKEFSEKFITQKQTFKRQFFFIPKKMKSFVGGSGRNRNSSQVLNMLRSTFPDEFKYKLGMNQRMLVNELKKDLKKIPTKKSRLSVLARVRNTHSQLKRKRIRPKRVKNLENSSIRDTRKYEREMKKFVLGLGKGLDDIQNLVEFEEHEIIKSVASLETILNYFSDQLHQLNSIKEAFSMGQTFKLKKVIERIIDLVKKIKDSIVAVMVKESNIIEEMSSKPVLDNEKTTKRLVSLLDKRKNARNKLNGHIRNLRKYMVELKKVIAKSKKEFQEVLAKERKKTVYYSTKTLLEDFRVLSTDMNKARSSFVIKKPLIKKIQERWALAYEHQNDLRAALSREGIRRNTSNSQHKDLFTLAFFFETTYNVYKGAINYSGVSNTKIRKTFETLLQEMLEDRNGYYKNLTINISIALPLLRNPEFDKKLYEELSFKGKSYGTWEDAIGVIYRYLRGFETAFEKRLSNADQMIQSATQLQFILAKRINEAEAELTTFYSEIQTIYKESSKRHSNNWETEFNRLEREFKIEMNKLKVTLRKKLDQLQKKEHNLEAAEVINIKDLQRLAEHDLETEIIALRRNQQMLLIGSK